MLLESLDKTISITIAVVSAALALWGHKREISRQRKVAVLEAQQKYADAELKRYAAERDFNHIRIDLGQLQENVKHLNDGTEARLDSIEKQISEILGALNVLTKMNRMNN